MKNLIVFLFFLSIGLSIEIFSQTYNVPELIYYRFEDNPTTTSITNFASNPVGTNPATISASNSLVASGQFDSCITGTGVSNSGVATGWLTDLGSGSWTISMWLNNIPNNTTLYYLFGEATGSFRCFMGGVAGAGSLILRGTGITDVPITGIAPGPKTVHIVYDSASSKISIYKDGVFSNSVNQTPLNLATGAGFKVGAYSSSAGLNGLMDEFRVYRRALDSTEIFATWNIELSNIVPVELTSFTANFVNGTTKIHWQTATELNNLGFEIERIFIDEETTNWIMVGFVEGNGTTTENSQYSFEDKSFDKFGTYKYRLKQIDNDGKFEYSQEIEVVVEQPGEFSLNQNYPNPFNPSTLITFSIAEVGLTKLTIYNSLGQVVAQPVNEILESGYYQISFDASNLSSGSYYYRVESGSFTSIKKMILMK